MTETRRREVNSVLVSYELAARELAERLEADRRVVTTGLAEKARAAERQFHAWRDDPPIDRFAAYIAFHELRRAAEDILDRRNR